MVYVLDEYLRSDHYNFHRQLHIEPVCGLPVLVVLALEFAALVEAL